MGRFGRSFLAMLLVPVLQFTLPGEASAQDKKVTLRVANYFPVTHAHSQAARTWMEEVTRLTNGEVVFEFYPAEQLGKAKDLLSLTQTGVVDVGGFAPSYVPDKMPLTAVAELPGGFGTSCQGLNAYWELAKEGGILAREEFAPNNVRPLLTLVNPPFQLLMKQRIVGTKSAENQKIRSLGGPQDILLKKLNAVPVRMAGPEVFESLSRGTLDGILFPLTSVISFDLHNLVKFATYDSNFGSGVNVYVISLEKWKSFSPAVQKAMLDAGQTAMRRSCEALDNDITASIAKLKAGGVTMVDLAPEERQKLASIADAVALDWAAGVEQRRKPATKVLQEFKAAVKR
ncbi:MAG: TRAP transporter substrate-binding protein DctP [Betaproteobacteria bacterium]|nr:TRAP transporter substrate-binding protein DctP [Betaproteobacteria bacterium]